MPAGGPPDHGALRHARVVAEMIRAQGVSLVPMAAAELTHAQFADALWGSDIAAAAAAYEAWAAIAPRPLAVTLHDVPGADPDPARDRRRAAGYARVVAASDTTIVSSRHEAAKVFRLSGQRSQVIELPIPPLPTPPDRPGVDAWSDRPTLGVLGFVYPGKGHVEVIDAAARHPCSPRVVVLGAVSPGHQALLQQLTAHAERLGVELVITGSLSDPVLAAAAAAVNVPCVPGRLVSASASLLSWLACRRRPLCAEGSYSRELDVDHPGLIERYTTGGELDELVAADLADPRRSRLEAVPTWPDVGLSHVRAYADLLRRRGVAIAR